nr:hypothetical protein [Tanacetum cinerariifolium]
MDGVFEGNRLLMRSDLTLSIAYALSGPAAVTCFSAAGNERSFLFFQFEYSVYEVCDLCLSTTVLLAKPAALGQLATNYRKSVQLTKSSERAGVRIWAPA